ncbi:MAG: hypothetical protein JWM98_3402 [Thermoleophilia bacterium]|nr:hypothetical protein [Thermoleophilia bacterium]
MRTSAHTRSARTPSHALRAALLVVAVVAASAMASLPSSAATSTTVVGATVVSSTSLDKDGCRSGVSGSTLLGSLTPGSGAVTSADCRIAFGSSNGTATLVASQADGTGSAMASLDTTLTRASDGQRMADVDMLTASNGWAVGQTGAIRRWDGTSWSTQASGTAASLTGVAVPTASKVFVATNTGNIRATFDGGSTWSTQYTGTNFLDVDAVSATVAWAVGNAGVIAATSNGTAWAPQTSGVTEPLAGVIGLSASTAVAVGDQGRIVRTTNGGTSWATVASGVAYSLNDIDGSATWLVASGDGGAIQSFDAGATWSAFGGLPGTVPYYATAVQNPSTVVLLGAYGEIQRSTNGGTSWSRVDSVYDNRFRAAALVGGTLLTSGDGAQLLSSTDLGTTFAASAEFTPTLYGVAADGRDEAWVVGSGGVIRHTSDGTTFTAQASPTTNMLADVVTSGPSRAWAVGEGGTIVATTDAGASWATQVSGVTSRLRAVEAADDQRAWAVGEYGVVLRTTNGGATWTSSSAGIQTLKSIAVGSAQVVWVSGSANSVQRSTDGGASWSAVALPGAFNNDSILVAGASSDGQRAVVASSGGLVYRTGDGGASWTPYTNLNSPGTGISALDADDDNAVTTAGATLTVRTTFDGGATVSTASGSTPTRAAEHIALTSAHAVWVSGETNTVAHLDGGADTVPDFTDDVGNTSGNDWGTPGASLFGACLRALGSATADAWTVDANANCTAADSDPWRAIPASRAAPSAVVAHTTLAGATATADLRFGLRAGTSQPAGAYASSIRFEVVAP